MITPTSTEAGCEPFYCLSWLASGSGCARHPFLCTDANIQVGNQQQNHSSAAIQQNVGRNAGPVRQKGLVKLIQACDERRAEQGEHRIQQKADAGQAHPPCAQPQKAHRAITDKVPSLANVVVQDLPAVVGDVAEDVFPQPAQRGTRVVGTKPGSRLQSDYANACCNRPPGAKPIARRLALCS